MDKPIRVLQVMSSMNRGGAETMIMNIYRNIDRSKVQFDFVVHTDKESHYEDEILSLGGKVYSISKYRGKNHFAYRKAWKEFFDQHNEHKVIHGHVRSTALIYLSIAKKYGLITIAHSHNTASDNNIKGLVKNILQYPLRYKADYLFSCSDLAGKWLFGSKAINRKNYFLLKNAIKARDFVYNEKIREEKRKELDLIDKLVIGHVGRFNHQKNHEFLIDIFNRILKLENNAVLLLIGQGNLMEEIKEKVEKLKIEDKVIFMGVRGDIPELLQAIDLIIFPSFYEGLPVTMIEAQAAGVPCLISDTITKEVIITDLIKQMSIKEDAIIWAEKAMEMVSKYIKENKYDGIVKNGYDIDTTANWLQNFYMKLSKGEK